MDKAEMARRCDSAKDEGTACLKDHRLDFTRRSDRRDCAVADVVKEKGSKVWGVIYEISEGDCKKLDGFEGYRPGRAKDANSYNREIIEVFEKGNSNKPKKVSIYMANREPDPGLPSQEYLDYILRGARDRCSDFPPSYIEILEQVETL